MLVKLEQSLLLAATLHLLIVKLLKIRLVEVVEVVHEFVLEESVDTGTFLIWKSNLSRSPLANEEVEEPPAATVAVM